MVCKRICWLHSAVKSDIMSYTTKCPMRSAYVCQLIIRAPHVTPVFAHPCHLITSTPSSTPFCGQSLHRPRWEKSGPRQDGHPSVVLLLNATFPSAPAPYRILAPPTAYGRVECQEPTVRSNRPTWRVTRASVNAKSPNGELPCAEAARQFTNGYPALLEMPLIHFRWNPK
jgi:hypothetical protein